MKIPARELTFSDSAGGKLTWWAHYNKPMHQKTGIDIMTVHFKNECRFVRSIKSDGGFHTHNRKQHDYQGQDPWDYMGWIRQCY